MAAAVLGTALLVTSCADAFSGIKETALAISTDGRTRLDAILLPCQSGRVAKTGLIELFMNEPTVTSIDRTALRPTTTSPRCRANRHPGSLLPS